MTTLQIENKSVFKIGKKVEVGEGNRHLHITFTLKITKYIACTFTVNSCPFSSVSYISVLPHY